MDPKSQEILNAIINKTPESLNRDEIAFLRARSSYLKPADAEVFESILTPKPEPKSEPEVVEKPVKSKKGK